MQDDGNACLLRELIAAVPTAILEWAKRPVFIEGGRNGLERSVGGTRHRGDRKNLG
jgi:hypothetical protein